MAARIFISHSSKADTKAQNFRDVLIARLRDEKDADGKPRFDVLCDFLRLESGAEWRDEIYTWMGLCDASIILVSQAAIEISTWVPRESSILLYRRTLQPQFTVIPVIISPAKREDLNTGYYKDLNFTEIHDAPVTDEVETIDRIIKRLESVRPSLTPLERMAEQVASELQKDGLSLELARDCCDRLNVNLAAWVTLKAPLQALALALLQVPLREATRALKETPHSWERWKSVLSLLAPTWVDLCAARHVAEVGLSSPPKAPLLLNAHEKESAKMYVQRACCRPPQVAWKAYPWLEIFGEKALDDLKSEIECLLMKALIRPPLPQNVQVLQNVMKIRQEEGEPTFIVLDYRKVPKDLQPDLPILQEAFPLINFLFFCGEDFPSVTDLPFQNMRLIEPKLPSGAEATAIAEYATAMSIINEE